MYDALFLDIFFSFWIILNKIILYPMPKAIHALTSPEFRCIAALQYDNA